MGAVRIERSGEPLDVLLKKLQDPTPLLQELGADAAALVNEQLVPGHGVSTGMLKSGFQDYTIHQDGATWIIGVGDASILTNWDEKAPSGRIAAFVRWLRNENKANSAKRAKASEKRRAAAKEKSARMEAVHRRVDVEAQKRAKFKESYAQAAKDLARTGKLEHFNKLAKMRGRFGKSYSAQRKLVRKIGIAEIRKSELPEYHKLRLEQLEQNLRELFTPGRTATYLRGRAQREKSRIFRLEQITKRENARIARQTKKEIALAAKRTAFRAKIHAKAHKPFKAVGIKIRGQLLFAGVVIKQLQWMQRHVDLKNKVAQKLAAKRRRKK